MWECQLYECYPRQQLLGRPVEARHLEVVPSLCHNTVLCSCLLPEVVTGFVAGTLGHGTRERRRDTGD